MSSWALSSLRRVALDLQSFEDGRCPQEAAEAFVLHLELVYRELLTQEQLDGHSSNITRACFMISTAIETRSNNHCCRAPVVQSGHVGRPRFDIPQEQMIALVAIPFLQLIHTSHFCSKYPPISPTDTYPTFLQHIPPISATDTYPTFPQHIPHFYNTYHPFLQLIYIICNIPPISTTHTPFLQHIPPFLQLIYIPHISTTHTPHFYNTYPHFCN